MHSDFLVIFGVEFKISLVIMTIVVSSVSFSNVFDSKTSVRSWIGLFKNKFSGQSENIFFRKSFYVNYQQSKIYGRIKSNVFFLQTKQLNARVQLLTIKVILTTSSYLLDICSKIIQFHLLHIFDAYFLIYYYKGLNVHVHIFWFKNWIFTMEIQWFKNQKAFSLETWLYNVSVQVWFVERLN